MSIAIPFCEVADDGNRREPKDTRGHAYRNGVLIIYGSNSQEAERPGARDTGTTQYRYPYGVRKASGRLAWIGPKAAPSSNGRAGGGAVP